MKTRLNQDRNHSTEQSVRILASVGVSVEVPLSVLRRAALSQGFAPYYCVVIVIFLLIASISSLSNLSVDLAFPIAAAALLVFGVIGWLLMYAFFSFLIWARKKDLMKTVYAPVFTVPLVLVSSKVSVLIDEQFAPAGTDAIYKPGDLALFMVMILLFEFLWVRYVAPACIAEDAGYETRDTVLNFDRAAPSARQDLHAPDLASSPVGTAKNTDEVHPPASPSMLELPFDLLDVNYVRSEQHMLRFHLVDREIVRRGRLKDLVHKMGNEVGMQINRSTWAPFASITNFQKDDDSWYVTFQDGRREKVTSTRLMAFTIAYEKFNA